MSRELNGRPVRVSIRSVRITADSGIDARQLADRMPTALEREFSRLRLGTIRRSDRTPADRAAHEIASAVAHRMRTMT